jgi:hypothetical protein
MSFRILFSIQKGIFLNKHWKDKLDLNRVMRENVFVHVDKQIKIDEDITSPQVKEALDKNNCTYCCTGENFQRQYSEGGHVIHVD